MAGSRDLAETMLVASVGNRIGFGRVMQLCEQVWREKEARVDGVGGGEYTVGPCAVSLVPCGCSTRPVDWCAWCVAVGRVTKLVREAQERMPRAEDEVEVLKGAYADLRKDLAAMTAARDEACALAESYAEDAIEYGSPPVETIARLRAVGKAEQ